MEATLLEAASHPVSGEKLLDFYLIRVSLLELEPISPFIDLPIGFLLGDTVASLNFACQLITFAIYLSDIIICELTPLLAQATDDLLPVALYSIPDWTFLHEFFPFLKHY